MNVMQKKLLRLSKTVLGVLVVPLCCLMLVSSAAAEQIKITDSSGNTRSMMELTAGTSATVRVTLKGTTNQTPEGTNVSLMNSETNKQTQSTTANSAGIAEFPNVSAGTYSLSIGDQKMTIADVQVIKLKTGGQQSSVSDEKTREVGRAMYVGGASAVAGVAGIAAAVSSGSSGSGSGSGGSVGLVTTDGSVRVREGNTLGQPKPVPKPKPKPKPVPQADFTGVQPAPDPGPPDPAPTFDPDSGNEAPGTGDPENPDEPGNDEIVPPPDPEDPVTPT